ncbi:MAG: endonuclease III [Muribaculaceae bacterium]|nr:endonuclease III [Muribaculaceae bacterium]MDE6134266.1 endonuclease III [Muribaculaceae bacterium]
MTVKERYRIAIERMAEHMPEPRTELHYDNPYQLLVAVILSAQCTDKRVNMITPALFEAYPDAQALAQAEAEDVFALIRSCSYPNNKTRSLLGMARRLTDEFGGRVPDDIDSLTSLPGVGRKTANVILSVVYDRPAMAVDTHVFRVAERIGLTTGSSTPLNTEKTLTANIPRGLIGRAHHWLILHGRYVCKARRPECDDCFLSDICRHHINELKSCKKSLSRIRQSATPKKPRKE